MKKTLITLTALSLLTPVFAFAALNGVKGLLSAALSLGDSVVKVIFALCMVYFFWGVGQFILNAGNEKTRAEGQQRMLWGIIALTVFISIYGIIKVFGDIVGIPTGIQGGSIDTPGGNKCVDGLDNNGESC